MDEQVLSLKTMFITGVVFFLLSMFFIFFLKHDIRTQVVFCDVGQGDGAYIRTENNIDIVIDAGKSKNILTCLGKYMPFYDRTIEYALLSHFQTDHYGGFNYILGRYKINNFIVTKDQNKTEKAEELFRLVKDMACETLKIKSGNKIVLSNDTGLIFFWPDEQVLTYLTDNNELSQVVLFYQDKFQVLFTGDIPSDRLKKILQTKLKLGYHDKLDIFKVPHHGSRYNLNQQILSLADPLLSVISVGKTNSFGHPAKQVLDTFKALNKKYLSTAVKGDIVIKYKIGSWQIVESN